MVNEKDNYNSSYFGEQFIRESKFEGNRWWMLQFCWVNQEKKLYGFIGR